MSRTLWTRNFTIITLGTGISAIGGVAMSFALSFVVFDNTGSTLLMGVFSAVSLLPHTLIPVLAAPYLDNFRRKPVIVGLDYFTGVAFLVMGVYLLSHSFQMEVYLAFSLLINTAGAVYQLAYSSLYPNLIPKGFAQKGYTVSGMLYPTVIMVMTPVASVLYTSFGLPVICLGEGDVQVELLPFGAAVRAIRVPDRQGRATDICLGYDRVEDYRDRDACFGGTIGRCANRIGGAAFTLDGRTFRLTANEGANQLHGGVVGFHKKLWRFTCAPGAVTFALDSPDGEEGFPGNVHAEVTYALSGDTLTVDYRAVSDADTVVNLTNHAYFNLAGHDGGPVSDHTLTVRAEAYTPAGAGNVPTGEIAPVAGTPLDLRSGAVLGDRLGEAFLAASRGYDHNYVLDRGGAPAAELWCPRTGIGLELSTSLPGMQLYTAGFLTERTGKSGAVYSPGHAVCLEPQFFPDAVNHANFPSPVLRAGAEYRQTIRYRFFVR